MACKGKVWGIKRERGNRRTQDKAERERERESLKVRVLGFVKEDRKTERVKVLGFKNA